MELRGLPAALAKGCRIGGGEAATATTTAAATTPSATTAATAIAGHLRKTGVNLLLGFREDFDQVTSLLSICLNHMLAIHARVVKYQGREEHTLSGE